MTTSEELVTVRLLDVPLSLREKSITHGEELLREMDLIAAGSESGQATDVPVRLLELVEELRRVYAPYVQASMDELENATAAGQTTMPEVVYRLPGSALGFVDRLAQVMAEADDYCRAGDHLLTLAAPPDVQAYRAWSIGEIRRQFAGQAPTPWPAYAADRGL